MAGREVETPGTQLYLILTSGRAPLIRINWDGELSGYAENPDNWIFSLKIRLLWQFEAEKDFYKWLF
jgi:hypothetical protein